MRSLISTNSRPYRHFGGVALHNRALRIISKRTEHLHSRGQRHYRHRVQTAFARSHSRAKTGNPFENKNLILQLNSL